MWPLESCFIWLCFLFSEMRSFLSCPCFNVKLEVKSMHWSPELSLMEVMSFSVVVVGGLPFVALPDLRSQWLVSASFVFCRAAIVTPFPSLTSRLFSFLDSWSVTVLVLFLVLLYVLFSFIYCIIYLMEFIVTYSYIQYGFLCKY